MKNMDEINLSIKNEIKNHLLGHSFKYKGLPKTVKNLISWNWPLKFDKLFKLEEVPTMGNIEVSVEFTALVLFDIDGNSADQSYLNGNFGPIGIDFSGSDYILDYSAARCFNVSTS